MKRQSTEDKFNILYARLSRDDDQIGESGSIQNQKMILEKFAKDNGFDNTLTLVDEGYSGTSFQRPSFMKILELMEQDKVAAIICKDHSRLGRNYLVIGGLMDEFQKKNIRYIAIHDNIDTSKGVDDFLPLHDVFNEFHAKNTIKKIRAVVQAKGKSGKRLGFIPPYGYRKDENGELIIDEVAAKVVQRIFAMYVSGVNAGTIANTLNSEHLLIPSAYKYEHGIVSKPRACKDPYFWNATTIHKLLNTQEYIGDTVNFKTYSNSYKDSKSRENDKDKRLIFKDTHPAIISKDIVFAEGNDIPAWMDLLSLVVDGFPYLNEIEYLEQLKQCIRKKQAMIMKDENIIIGAMAFRRDTGSIDFLGIHPQYDKKDIAKTFMQKALGELLKDVPISITTFREGDKADPGYRRVFQNLGFAEAELIIEFGYTTQKLTLQKENLEVSDCV